jgi:hypothetical protein
MYAELMAATFAVEEPSALILRDPRSHWSTLTDLPPVDVIVQLAYASPSRRAPVPTLSTSPTRSPDNMA